MVAQIIKETAYGRDDGNIDVAKFIKENVTPYYGDDSFLCGPTERTLRIWARVSELMKQERIRGVLDADTSTPSSITSHAPGYIDKDNEIIFGLQTDAPLKRAIMPNGGYRMVEASCKAYGLPVDEKLKTIYTKYRKTHNDGVFDVYNDEIRRCRHSAILTGLPDAYGRGRIIGDYRRIALYGMDRLIEEKMHDKFKLDDKVMNEENIRLREELSEQIRALYDIKAMAMSYGVDISNPAQSFKEAVQFTYFGYLAAIKDQNGAAMSLGRVSTFTGSSPDEYVPFSTSLRTFALSHSYQSGICENSVSPSFAFSSLSSLISHSLPQALHLSTIPSDDILNSVMQFGHWYKTLCKPSALFL